MKPLLCIVIFNYNVYAFLACITKTDRPSQTTYVFKKSKKPEKKIIQRNFENTAFFKTNYFKRNFIFG